MKRFIQSIVVAGLVLATTGCMTVVPSVNDAKLVRDMAAALDAAGIEATSSSVLLNPSAPHADRREEAVSLIVALIRRGEVAKARILLPSFLVLLSEEQIEALEFKVRLF